MMKRERVTRHITATITVDDIRFRFNIPPSAKITFRVPSGGDYSGNNVELDREEQVITASWEEVDADKEGET